MSLSLSLKPFTITTGKALLINSSLLSVLGAGSSALEIGIRCQGGSLSLSGLAVTPSADQAQGNMNWFSLTDYTSGKIAFVADGSSTPSFSFWVREVGSSSLPEGNSEGIAPQIVYKHVNLAPTLAFDLGALQEGQLKTITADMIHLSDVDTPEDQLGEITLKVAKITGGSFLLAGTAAKAFTYADVLHGLVSFQHDGNNAAPLISLQALDAAVKPLASAVITASVAYSSFNEGPVISILKPAQIKLGLKTTIETDPDTGEKTTDFEVLPGRVALNTLIKITSEDSPLSSSSFTATPWNCQLVYLNPLTKTYDNWQGSFTAADLPKLFVQKKTFPRSIFFLNDNGEFEPDIEETLPPATLSIDWEGGWAYLSVYCNNPMPYDKDGYDDDTLYSNLAPSISAVSIQGLRSGASLRLRDYNFSFTDNEKYISREYDENDKLISPTTEVYKSRLDFQSVFTVSVLKGCAFRVHGTISTSFSLLELMTDSVEIVHLGQPGINPSFSITVKDPQGLSSKALAVDLDAQVALAVKAPLAITEGADLKLSTANLLISASKAQLAAGFQIKVVEAEHGQVGTLNAVTKVFTPMESFSYADLKAGKIIFRHNGDDTIPSLKLAVDGQETWLPFTFKSVDDAPVLALNALAINSGETILLSSDVFALAYDEELPESLWDSLMVSVKANSGLIFKVAGVEVKAFSISDVDNDLVSVIRSASGSASASLALTDATGKVSTLQTLGSVARATVNDFAPNIQLGSLNIAEGQTIALSTAHINASDADANTPDYEVWFLAFTEHCSILKAGQESNSFTLADVKAGRISLRHDGSSFSPVLSLQVGDANPDHESNQQDLAINFTLVDSAPTGFVTVSGNPAEDHELFVYDFHIDDQDGGVGSDDDFVITWKDQAGNSVAEGGSLFLDQSHVGKKLQAVISYTDGEGHVNSLASALTATVTNVNDAPEGNLDILGAACVGRTLMALPSISDEDGIPTTPTYTWTDRNDITLGTGPSLTLTSAHLGKNIYLTASYTDAFGKAESFNAYLSAAVGVANAAPTGSVSITGNATQGETLNASNSLVDSDGKGTVTYTWRDHGGNEIGTGSSLVLTQNHVGDAISVLASYTDGKGVLESVLSTATSSVSGSDLHFV